MRKKGYDIEFELFRLMVNKLSLIDFTLLSDNLNISKKTCSRYYKKYCEINNEKLYYINDNYKHFNQASNSITIIQYNELQEFKKQVFDNENISEKLKVVLLKLIASNLLSFQKFDSSFSKILNCVEQKLFLKISKLYTEKAILTDEVIAPIFIDIEKSELYSISLNGYNLHKINIHAIEGLSIVNKKTNDIFCEYHNNTLTSESILDDFNIPYIEEENCFMVRILLDNYAKSELLYQFINTKNKIKLNNEHKFKFRLETKVHSIDLIAKFIIFNNKHVQIVGDRKFKKAFKEYSDNFSKDLATFTSKLGG